MALKIIKANEPIQITRLNLCIYAPPGVGKTSLGFTADDPLDLDFDNGVYRACNRKDSVPCNRWSDVSEMGADDLTPYKTIIVDTAGRALDKLSTDIIADNPKNGKKDGALSLQGFGVLKARFAAWLKVVNGFGKDVTLICHMDEQRNGDDMIERLDAQGSSKGEIYKSVDAMGRIFVRQGKDKKTQRFLDFSPREGSFGKNPGQLEELEIPHPDKNPRFLAEVIASIKAKLNTMSEEQIKERERMDEWKVAIDDLRVLDDFNLLIGNVRQAPDAIKMYFHGRATEKGFTFDKKAGEYVAAGKPEKEKVYA